MICLERLRAEVRDESGVKKKLWGGEFWSDGYFASTVGKHGTSISSLGHVFYLKSWSKCLTCKEVTAKDG